MDQAQSSLGAMTKDAKDVEGESAAAARSTVQTHGGHARYGGAGGAGVGSIAGSSSRRQANGRVCGCPSCRETEDEGIADAVMDQQRTDKGFDQGTSPVQPFGGSYASPPKNPS